MAEPTVLDDLRKISSSKVHSSWGQNVERMVSFVQGIAEQAILSNADAILPSKLPLEQRYNEDERQIGHVASYCANATSNLRHAIDRIADEPRDGQQRTQVAQQLGIAAKKFLELWAPFLIAAQGTGASHYRDEIERAVAEIRDAKTEVESIRDAAKKAASVTGTASHGEVFATLAREYGESARKWLTTTIVIAVIILLATVAVVWVAVKLPTMEYSRVIQIVVAKVVALSVLYFLLLLSARTYRSNYHLMVINRHRARALQSFEAFVKASDDVQTKNAVLLEATRCIFNHVTTGFIGSEEQSQPTQVVEILKALGPTSGKS